MISGPSYPQTAKYKRWLIQRESSGVMGKLIGYKTVSSDEISKLMIKHLYPPEAKSVSDYSNNTQPDGNRVE